MSTQSSSAPQPRPPPANEEEARACYEKALKDSDYTPLSSVCPLWKDRTVSVMGILKDIGTPCDSRKDMMQTIRLLDPFVNEDVLVRIFRSDYNEFPNAKFGTGKTRVLLLQGMKVWKNFSQSGEMMLIAGKRYGFTIVSDLPGDPRPTWEKGPPGTDGALFSQKVLDATRALDLWYKHKTGRVYDDIPGSIPGSGVVTEQTSARVAPSKEVKIEDMEASQYYDVTGKIVKIYDELDHRVSIYITDYTKNSKLYRYTYDENDDYKDSIWNGPLGQHSLQITAWDQNAQRAKDLHLMEGMYIFCRNVATKIAKSGNLEGSMYPDKKWPDKALIHVVEKSDARITEIEKRKDAYSLEYETYRDEYVVKSTQEQREAKKPKKNKDTVKEPEPIEEEEDEESDTEPPIITKDRSEVSLAKQVRMENVKKPETLISKIIQKPKNGKVFNNLQYHIFCKVIDFLPNDIHDFSVKLDAGEVESEGENDADLDTPNYGDPKWIWKFMLLVEGLDGAKMQVVVSGKEAEYFLKVTACDLKDKENESHLLTLKEQLTKLWGNLADSKNPPARPKDEPKPPKMVETGAQTDPKKKKKRRRRRQKSAQNKKQKGEDGEADKKEEDGDAEDEEDGEVEAVEAGVDGGKWFDTCVYEYAVGEERLWKLLKTTIM